MISPRPEASKLARYRAGQGERTVVNLAHRQIALDPLSASLLPLLDGRHSREELVEEFVQRHSSNATAASETPASREEIEADVYSCLAALAGHALLKA